MLDQDNFVKFALMPNRTYLAIDNAVPVSPYMPPTWANKNIYMATYIHGRALGENSTYDIVFETNSKISNSHMVVYQKFNLSEAASGSLTDVFGEPISMNDLPPPNIPARFLTGYISNYVSGGAAFETYSTRLKTNEEGVYHNINDLPTKKLEIPLGAPGSHVANFATIPFDLKMLSHPSDSNRKGHHQFVFRARNKSPEIVTMGFVARMFFETFGIDESPLYYIQDKTMPIQLAEYIINYLNDKYMSLKAHDLNHIYKNQLDTDIKTAIRHIVINNNVYDISIKQNTVGLVDTQAWLERKKIWKP